MDFEYHGRGVYLVHAHGETFTVDLLVYPLDGKWNGQCDCWTFIRGGGLRDRILEAIADKSFVPHRRFRCPHIEAVREELLDLFLADLAKKFPDHKQPT